MARLVFTVVLFCIVLLRQAKSLTWEFGDDKRDLLEINHLSGRIKHAEKVKHIDVPLQPCMVAKYLLVVVFNDHSSPVVTYDADTSVVTISFTPVQQSMSSYDIMVKGKKKRNCKGGGNNNGHKALSGKKKKQRDYFAGRSR